MRSGLRAHLEPAGDAPGSSGQRHWLSPPAPGVFMGRGPRVGTRCSPGTRCRPPCTTPWWTSPKNTWKGRTPGILRGTGCAGQGMVWKQCGVMLLDLAVMLGCRGRSLCRDSSGVKPAIFKGNYFLLWRLLCSVAAAGGCAHPGSVPLLCKGVQRGAARGSWGTSLGGVCLVCSSWKIHPGARTTCLVCSSRPWAEGFAVEVTHVCHPGVLSALPALLPWELGALLSLLLQAVWGGSSSVPVGPWLLVASVMGGRWCLEREDPRLDPLFPHLQVPGSGGTRVLLGSGSVKAVELSVSMRVWMAPGTGGSDCPLQ
ncbi:uncharacterized protein LOC131586764 [Poecile atricapillus]|uniref:uncharacterized protein LOC131586764 n=1 Tax=Poecile atricapillus TaxID=48891 RepID=UPI002739D678|nr:uncharacterized protein LOC131586764 [Poecile atricapillus]XP_058709946.1 uncharacterized protein LOC131586764 [Poecile atricapillus]XP_058709947.1 uncharacterized protein LOC131586764 [Poecile atricapillus]XP_058709948.1 uncharacterized protein LOC131586764 [Poecile atricapillus]XP_058709949.1 uncharacterized protein LOC131586764 [Poecile atricapillus]XP_058709950.1 uncharacterized protein LOC131586764 [Poecile atricapillus]XP_058709952.1 uncharacterized protein LOC131586764 [Poecile atri